MIKIKIIIIDKRLLKIITISFGIAKKFISL